MVEVTLTKQAVAGVLLAVVLFRFLLPLVLRYQLGSNDLRLVLGPWVLRRIMLDQIVRARPARVFRNPLRATLDESHRMDTVFLEAAEGSSISPGLLISPSKPAEFIERLERARRGG